MCCAEMRSVLRSSNGLISLMTGGFAIPALVVPADNVAEDALRIFVELALDLSGVSLGCGATGTARMSDNLTRHGSSVPPALRWIDLVVIGQMQGRVHL